MRDLPPSATSCLLTLPTYCSLLQAAMLEIYNEELRDLLGKGPPVGKKHTVRLGCWRSMRWAWDWCVRFRVLDGIPCRPATNCPRSPLLPSPQPTYFFPATSNRSSTTTRAQPLSPSSSMWMSASRSGWRPCWSAQ